MKKIKNPFSQRKRAARQQFARNDSFPSHLPEIRWISEGIGTKDVCSALGKR
jgi:hypothetical protein